MVRYCRDNVEIVDIVQTVRSDYLQWNPSRSLPSGPNQSSLPPLWNILFHQNKCTVVQKYKEKEKLTFRYRNMKFSRNDLPFRKAPKKMSLSAISLSVSLHILRTFKLGPFFWWWRGEKETDVQISFYLPQIWCRWVCLWCCPCWGSRWAPPRRGRTCVFRSHHQSLQSVLPYPS